MQKIISLIKKGKLWTLPGGIHPYGMKQQTSALPIRSLPLAPYFILPLEQYPNTQGRVLVNVGDKVLKGEPLTRCQGNELPIHASTSGIIKAIDTCNDTHPSGLPVRAIYLEADGQDIWRKREPISDYQSYDRDNLILRIQQAGIAGLGGAGFPAATKLKNARYCTEMLIINGAECEPYITADDRLMQEQSKAILEGIKILQYLLKPAMTVIAIEDNKPEAIAAMNRTLQTHTISSSVVRVIPTKYPSGSAKQLIKILTGKELAHDVRSSSIGILMYNVGTVYAIKEAIIDDIPLIQRVTTITGKNAATPGNFWLPIGTPIASILSSLSSQDKSQIAPRIIIGGPLMGFILPDWHSPITKITNCLLLPTEDEMPPEKKEQNCIRCGYCAEACPVNLLPQQLYWYSKGKEHNKTAQHRLSDCIECGICAYVCPSNIPLVLYFRKEKALIKEEKRAQLLAEGAKQRFEAKELRYQTHKQARAALQQKNTNNMDSKDKGAIEAALARIKAKKETASQRIILKESPLKIRKILNAEKPMQRHSLALNITTLSAQIENPIEPYLTPTVSQSYSQPSSEQDARKAAVAKAIERAKARREQQLQAKENNKG